MKYLLLAACSLAAFLALATSSVTVVVNGDQVSFDQPPVMRNGRVMVPLRGVFEKLGAQVEWYADERRVEAKKGDREVELWVNKVTAEINGQKATMDQAPIVVGGRTLVPLRFISESLGANVDWNASSSTVTITGN